MTTIILPELGEGIEKATVAVWHVREGDQVQSDDEAVEMVTDKASFNVQAGSNGVIKKILVSEGQDVKIGDILAEID